MKFLTSLTQLLPSQLAYAHCDIPCGIYDPHQAQMAAHTVLRMTDLILQTHEEDSKDEKDEEMAERNFTHQIARLTRVKEEHGSIVEEELGTLEIDYFKPEHFAEYSELEELLKKTAKLSVKVRQEINKQAAEELLANVQQIAKIFGKPKILNQCEFLLDTQLAERLFLTSDKTFPCFKIYNFWSQHAALFKPWSVRFNLQLGLSLVKPKNWGCGDI